MPIELSRLDMPAIRVVPSNRVKWIINRTGNRHRKRQLPWSRYGRKNTKVECKINGRWWPDLTVCEDSYFVSGHYPSPCLKHFCVKTGTARTEAGHWFMAIVVDIRVISGQKPSLQRQILCIVKTQWPQSASELYRPSDRSLLATLVPTFAERGCHVVSVTDPYGRILAFLDRSRYFFFQVAPQFYSRGWVDPVPDPLN
jgi:hypothetical protein